MRSYRRDRRGRFARGGVVGSSPTPKARYKAAKKANAKAHRSRVKGSVKARGKEIVTTAPRRSKNLVGGTAIYAGGRYMGSARAQSIGLDMAKAGLRGGAGRVGATRAMSKGLKRSRNAQAKKEYFRATGKSQARRNVAKLAAVGVVGAAVLYGVKNEHLGARVKISDNLRGGEATFGVNLGSRGKRAVHGSYVIGRSVKNGKKGVALSGMVVGAKGVKTKSGFYPR